LFPSLYIIYPIIIAYPAKKINGNRINKYEQALNFSESSGMLDKRCAKCYNKV